MRLIIIPVALACLLVTSSSVAATVPVVETIPKLEGVIHDDKVTLVNLWATWCVPCVMEMPDLQQIQTDIGPRLRIVGVSLDDAVPGDREKSRARVARFLERKKITFENVYWTGRVPAIQERFEFEGEIPLTVLYDARGREVWRHQGRIDRAEVIRRVKDALKSGGSR